MRHCTYDSQTPEQWAEMVGYAIYQGHLADIEFAFKDKSESENEGSEEGC